MPNPCHHQILASGPIARVERCAACEVVSLHIGPTTLRLDTASCESIWVTLTEALDTLRSLRRSSVEAGTPRGLA